MSAFAQFNTINNNLIAGSVLANFQNKNLASVISNMDFNSELAYGSKLKIPYINSTTVQDYTKYTALSTQAIEGDFIELPIDFSKAFSLQMDDVDKVENSADVLVAATQDAGYRLSDEFDKAIFTKIGSGGTTITLSSAISTDNIKSTLLNIVTALDKKNVPENDRFLVVTPEVSAIILDKLADILTDNNKAVVSGTIGTVYGLNIFKSNLTENCLYGCKSAITTAVQIKNVEKIRHPDFFADVVRGLMVGGEAITRPTCCGKLEVSE